MELHGLVTVAIVLAAAPAAPALGQTAASEPGAGSQTLASDVKPQPPRDFANVGMGARLGAGVAYSEGVPDAWLVRLEHELFPFITPRHTVGGLFGFMIGFDYWHARDGVPNNWGIGLPASFVLGMRAVAVRALVGLGVNALTIDQVDDDTGFGWFAPMAMANVGVDLFGWTAMLDTRVSRRWQFGAPDHTQWMFSVMIGRTFEPRHDQAFYNGPAPGK
jgi:hypothetical protein